MSWSQTTTQLAAVPVQSLFNAKLASEFRETKLLSPEIQENSFLEAAMERDTVGRPMEILLVEDSLVAARLTIGALKRSNVQHRLTWLSDGAEAMAFLHQAGRFSRAPQPDVVLLDLLLPEVNGRDILAEIRGSEKFSSIAVVVMTSATEGRDVLLPEPLRVDGYLQKPFDMEEFLKLIRTLKDLWAADMILPDE